MLNFFDFLVETKQLNTELSDRQIRTYGNTIIWYGVNIQIYIFINKLCLSQFANREFLEKIKTINKLTNRIMKLISQTYFWALKSADPLSPALVLGSRTQKESPSEE